MVFHPVINSSTKPIAIIVSARSCFPLASCFHPENKPICQIKPVKITLLLNMLSFGQQCLLSFTIFKKTDKCHTQILKQLLLSIAKAFQLQRMNFNKFLSKTSHCQSSKKQTKTQPCGNKKGTPPGIPFSGTA